MKKKRLPRLWCALQGLMPIEACLAAQRGELAWPPEPKAAGPVSRAVAVQSASTGKRLRR